MLPFIDMQAVLHAGQDMTNMVGHVTVQELDWSTPDQYSAVSPPFDYVLAADCVYHEHIVEDFLRTVLAVTHTKSTGSFLSLHPFESSACMSCSIHLMLLMPASKESQAINRTPDSSFQSCQ